MIRDIKERLEEFGLEHFAPDDEGIMLESGSNATKGDFLVKQIGLNMSQIKQYSPPPNPAKITDPRAKWYIGHFGKTSWEVDALTPKVLHELVQENVEKLIDMDLFEEQKRLEEKGRQKIQKIIDEDEANE